MSPVLPADSAAIDPLKIRRIDEGCGLERVARSLTGHVAVRQSAEFRVDQRDQPVER
jgi:hypothetical protein